MATCLDSPLAAAELLSHQQVGNWVSRLKSGRVEKRAATVRDDVGWLRERHDWPGLSAACLAVIRGLALEQKNHRPSAR